MTGYFPDPEPPVNPGLYAYVHTHELTQVGARLNPNGTWGALFGCSLCPDIVVGDHVGPIPDGYCHHCGWVQEKPERKKCEECKAPLNGQPVKPAGDEIWTHGQTKTCDGCGKQVAWEADIQMWWINYGYGNPPPTAFHCISPADGGKHHVEPPQP